ncbi:transporter [Sphaerisporangium siamense]|uniref:ABC transporter permease n=1 Tax=Sphaerisporangium siamense TaxID=795645 RepID=A0A7W7D693_9ACTN|nr:ABC transporter permease subunit [Sphaerisporangium siamense]MBB4701040.1 hypothetical protein [Sphaerisporangium siamense]GII85815.1 transporter [Sphaerisporangium siamense]
MIWLTWRQFRAAAMMAGAALAVLAAVLGLTGPGIAGAYTSGLATCGPDPGGCAAFLRAFAGDHEGIFLTVNAVVLVVPALIGLFWGAPLITREIEAGTHRLVWNQSVTRTRWLAVKLAFVGLAAMVTAGVTGLAATWWAGPLDGLGEDVTRMTPLLFGERGVAPIGYAVFAFTLGVTAGMFVRRTVAAMALTLALFTVVQLVMPTLVRPHLLTPVRKVVQISESTVGEFRGRRDGPIDVEGKSPEAGAWVLSNRTLDGSGRHVDSIPLAASSGPCAPSPAGLGRCFAEMTRLGYRLELTYHPISRFWPFQWIEFGIYAVLALGLAGVCFRRIRRHVS